MHNTHRSLLCTAVLLVAGVLAGCGEQETASAASGMSALEQQAKALDEQAKAAQVALAQRAEQHAATVALYKERVPGYWRLLDGPSTTLIQINDLTHTVSGVMITKEGDILRSEDISGSLGGDGLYVQQLMSNLTYEAQSDRLRFGLRTLDRIDHQAFTAIKTQWGL